MSYKGKSKGSYGNNQRHGKSGFHSFGKGKNRNETFEDNTSFENRSKCQVEPESQEPETEDT